MVETERSYEFLYTHLLITGSTSDILYCVSLSQLIKYIAYDRILIIKRPV